MSDGHVRTLGYALTSDGYDGEDISILATHLFDGRQLVGLGLLFFGEPDLVCVCRRRCGGLDLY